MSKSNKLTVWIFIALILGVIAGALLNAQYPAPPVKTYDQALQLLKTEVDAQQQKAPLTADINKVLADSTLNDRAKWEKVAVLVTSEKKAKAFAEVAAKAVAREEVMDSTLKQILEYISILTDI
ncbi:MAG: hypothetical protein ACOVMR_02935, partial [Flavobacteriales bacterium]